MNTSETYLGKGLKYPLRWWTGNSEVTSAEQKVADAIVMLLDTSIGERFMLPTYGTRLRQLIFSLRDNDFEGLAADYIITDILLWEKRVRAVTNVSFQYPEDGAGHSVLIHLTLELINSQVPLNMVYPFFGE